jgi:Fe-S-cluster containining protein
MHIPVDIFDVIAAARRLKVNVDEVYHRNYTLGITPIEDRSVMGSVALKLKKPCPYLELDKCSIYGIRPLPCILFPEYHAAVKALPGLGGQRRYNDYKCLQTPFDVPDERMQVLQQLQRIMYRELLVSNSYLFNGSPYWIDFGRLDRGFIEEALPGLGIKAKTRRELERILTFEMLERIFDQCFRKLTPLMELEKRILRLKSRDCQARVFFQLQDHEKLRDLTRREDDRAVVLRIEKGRLKTDRARFISADHMAVW